MKENIMPSVQALTPSARPLRSEGDIYSADPAKAPHALYVDSFGEIPVSLYRQSLFSNTLTPIEQTGPRRVRVMVPADDLQRPIATPITRPDAGTPVGKLLLGALACMAGAGMFTAAIIAGPAYAAWAALGAIVCLIGVVLILPEPSDRLHAQAQVAQ